MCPKQGVASRVTPRSSKQASFQHISFAGNEKSSNKLYADSSAVIARVGSRRRQECDEQGNVPEGDRRLGSTQKPHTSPPFPAWHWFVRCMEVRNCSRGLPRQTCRSKGARRRRDTDDAETRTGGSYVCNCHLSSDDRLWASSYNTVTCPSHHILYTCCSMLKSRSTPCSALYRERGFNSAHAITVHSKPSFAVIMQGT